MSVGIALFISHYAPKKLATALSYVVDLLAAIPSVIYGLWGGLVLVPAIYPFLELGGQIPWLDSDFRRSPAKSLPYRGHRVRGAGRHDPADHHLHVPRHLPADPSPSGRGGSGPLGATKWEMVKLAVLPFGKSGVVSASMLGLGRALGETMAVLMILSPGLNYSVKLLQASQNQTIAANIAAQYPEANDLGVSVLIGTGLVLFPDYLRGELHRS